jgi:hypothetical protein
MSRTPSKALLMMTRRDDVVSAEVVQAYRNLRLCERAMAGDTAAAIEWLTKFGGPEWQPKLPVSSGY